MTGSPRKSGSVGNTKKRPPVTYFLQDKIVLSVDDQVIIRKMIKNFLSQLGVNPLNIREADDGDAALAALAEIKGTIGLILLDWNMPKMKGIDVLKAIRKNPDISKTPVLMVTAETHEEQIVLAVENGIDSYLIKPFTASDLEEKILNIFDPPLYARLIGEAEEMIEAEEYDKAIVTLEGVLKEKLDSAGARLLLGLAHKRMGDSVSARKWYSRRRKKTLIT